MPSLLYIMALTTCNFWIGKPMSRNRTTHPRKRTPISPARVAALHVLTQVLTKKKTLLDTFYLIDTYCEDPRDTTLAREIVSGTCRRLGILRYYLKALATHWDHFPDAVQRILEMAAYQLIYLDRVPPYAILSDAVELTRQQKHRNLTSAVNAILRKISKGTDSISLPLKEAFFSDYVATVHSHPLWLVEEWLTIWPHEQVESLCEFNNSLAPLSLRIRGDIQTAIERLEKEGIAFHVDERFDRRIEVAPQQPVPQSLFLSDQWTVQDGAAMLVAPLLAPQPGWRIWDVCAAPGGKTFHLSDLMNDQGILVASDLSQKRLDKLVEQKTRLKKDKICIQVLDAKKDAPQKAGDPFDAILVDAPCSGWGTFRRHPDSRWRLQPADMNRFARQAQKILENVKHYLKPGGILVYSTCTLSPAENEEVVYPFVERNKEYKIESVKDYVPKSFQDSVSHEGFLTVFPPTNNLDGAFAARLRKTY